MRISRKIEYVNVKQTLWATNIHDTYLNLGSVYKSLYRLNLLQGFNSIKDESSITHVELNTQEDGVHGHTHLHESRQDVYSGLPWPPCRTDGFFFLCCCLRWIWADGSDVCFPEMMNIYDVIHINLTSEVSSMKEWGCVCKAADDWWLWILHHCCWNK